MFRNGKLLFEGKKTIVNNEPKSSGVVISIEGAINLGSDMEAGDYALQVVVRDKLANKKRQLTSQYIQFEIVD